MLTKVILGLSGAFFALFASISAAAESANGETAKPGSGTIIFYRPDSAKGRAIRFNIDQAGKPIGQLLSGTKIELSLPAGTHEFSVRAPSVDGRDAVSINVEPGGTYFVKGTVLWGWPAGRPKFTVMTEATAASELAQLK